jgi:hypothetical protein
VTSCRPPLLCWRRAGSGRVMSVPSDTAND